MIKNQTLQKIILASISATVFMYLSTVSVLSPLIKEAFGSINLPAFVLSIFVFITILFLLRKTNILLSGFILQAGALIISVFLLTSFMFERYVFDYATNRSIESEIPIYYLGGSTVLLSGLVYFFYKRNLKLFSAKQTGFIYRAGLVIEIIVSIILVGLSVYHHFKNMNFLNRYNYYHLHAYTNSIFNIFWGQPFTHTITSCYGHYAFLYYPILKLAFRFGSHSLLINYMYISSFLVGITLGIWIIILHMNVKKPGIRILGIFMICYFTSARITGIYHQLYPHRTFPIAVMLLMISLWYKFHNKIITVTGYFVSICIIIWSTEIGLIAAVSWASLHICSVLQSKFSFKKILQTLFPIFFHIAAIPLTLFSALFLCGKFNMFFGGQMIPFKDFLFPLINTNYMDALEFQLDSFPSAWMSIILMFFAFLGVGLKDTVILNPDAKKNNQSAVCFAATVLGSGSLSYSINRPAYNSFFIILQFAGLFLPLTFDRFLFAINKSFAADEKHSSELSLKFNISYICLVVLLIIMISTIINIPYKINHDEYLKNMEPVNAIRSWIRQYKDKEAVPVSSSLSLLYAYLGWDPGVYFMDFSDIIYSEDFMNSFTETIIDLDRKYVFTTLEFRDNLPDQFLNTHNITEEVIYNYELFYCEPLQK